MLILIRQEFNSGRITTLQLSSRLHLLLEAQATLIFPRPRASCYPVVRSPPEHPHVSSKLVSHLLNGRADKGTEETWRSRVGRG